MWRRLFCLVAAVDSAESLRTSIVHLCNFVWDEFIWEHGGVCRIVSCEAAAVHVVRPEEGYVERMSGGLCASRGDWRPLLLPVGIAPVGQQMEWCPVVTAFPVAAKPNQAFGRLISQRRSG